MNRGYVNISQGRFLKSRVMAPCSAAARRARAGAPPPFAGRPSGASSSSCRLAGAPILRGPRSMDAEPRGTGVWGFIAARVSPAGGGTTLRPSLASIPSLLEGRRLRRRRQLPQLPVRQAMRERCRHWQARCPMSRVSDWRRRQCCLLRLNGDLS